MDNFDLKRFLVENKLTRNSILSELNEMANILKWTPEKLEQEANRYSTAGEFQKANLSAYQSYRNAVNKGLIQNKFEEQFRWTKDTLEQEAAKYNTSTEFQKANINAYNAYRRAVNKGIIQDKFEKTGFGTKWTKDTLEQEAAKYDTPKEFQQTNINAYTIYRRAVNRGLIQNKFEKKWTPEKLEQEAAKYNTPSEFSRANQRAYSIYKNAVNKGLIQDKFEKTGFGTKWTKDALEQEAAKYNTPSEFSRANQRAYSIYKNAVNKGLIQDKFEENNPTLKENKMQDFDLKRFLIENKMTRNSLLLNEQPETDGIPADDPLAQIPAVPAETPAEPSGEIDKETAKELIFNTGGKFFTVNFLAQDKDERGKQKVDANGVKLLRPRTMNARLGVKKYLRGGELKFNPDDFNLINVFDMVKKGYRFINADTIQSLKIGNRTYTVTQETTEPTTDEPQLNENISDLVVTYYKDKDNYGEKGLADGFHEEEGKKVKFIVGYDDMDEMDDIGYIYSKSGADIETDYTEDDLDNAFMNSL